MTKNFLLGLGAMKCGTTWVHDYLAEHPQASMGFIKEFHVFDTLYLDADVSPLKGELNTLAEIADTGQLKGGRQRATLTRLAMASNPNLYGAYFQSLAAAEQVRVVGDITPSYSGLSVDNLLAIKRLLKRYGFRLKPLYIMRDPVGRLKSHAAHVSRGSEPLRPVDEMRRMEDLIERNSVQAKSSYIRTLTTLFDAFKMERLVLVFEDLFREESLRQLTDYLEIDYVPADFTSRANASSSNYELTEAEREHFAQYFVDDIRAAMIYFGKDYIRKHWPSAQFVQFT
ncbi:MAG: sulfotransferase [Aliidiomarina sp.]|uniref:sulfotransferase n=1 Tax=Aliidiomarina sp. TaxID=1872439 RepID=UPI0025B8E551|nr:sulfotransferase [Aliidiomarina sp.]MCH8502316.1 sulfotransferase [Aliidiomarina sp.]